MRRAIVIVLLVAGCQGQAGPAVTPTPRDTIPAEVTAAPTEDIAQVTTPPIARPASYAALTKRTWQKVVKNPDAYRGKGYKLWACIWQFDAATGPDGFLAQASWRRETYWSLDGDNAAFVGDAALLADYVAGDIVTMSVVTLGSYSYDTQIGGNTTVPSFEVVRIARASGSCAP